MSKTTYIHYGSDHFDIDKFVVYDDKMRNADINEPGYGLWACRTDDSYGWKKYCEENGYHTDKLSQSFTFKLRRCAKIFRVGNLLDIKGWTTTYLNGLARCIDFNRIMDKYDGMELIHGKNYEDLRYSYFYSWDVDIIVIWNPQVLQLL